MKILSEHYKHYSLKNIFQNSSLTGRAHPSSSILYPLINRVENFTESLIACLRKGNESEGKLAAMVTSLFLIQLGQPDDELFIKFRDAILPTLRDESKASTIRKKVSRHHLEFINILFHLVRTCNWFDLFHRI